MLRAGIRAPAALLGLGRLAPLQREQPQPVDPLALLVHPVVLLEQLFPGLEVLEFYALLGLADGAGHPGVGDDFALLGAGAVHPARDPVGAEQPHQVVFERQVEHALAGVTLATGAAPQLAVDAPRLAPLAADDHEAARGLLVAAPL